MSALTVRRPLLAGRPLRPALSASLGAAEDEVEDEDEAEANSVDPS